MHKLPVLTPKKVIRLLREYGFIEHHQTGSHKIFYHPVQKRRVTVPFHTKDLPKGTLKTILRQAGIEK